MNTLSYSAFEANLAHTFDRVNDDHVPVLVTRPDGKSAVIASLEDFNAYEETAYLKRSSKNSARLNKAIAEIEASNFVQHDLSES